MKILVTGASGFLGWRLVRRLHAERHQVTALIHGKAIRRQDWPEGVHPVWGTMADEAWYEAGLRGVDAVVHCAWDSRMYPEARFEAANISGPLRLVEAADQAGVGRFIHLSSVAVYGLRRRAGWAVLTEDAPLIASGDEALSPYPWGKARLDDAMVHFGRRSRMPVIILRPGLIFGDSRAPAKHVFAVGGTRLAVLVGAGGNRLPYIHVDDVVDAIDRCLALEDGASVFNVVPTQMVSHARVMQAWAHASGFRCVPVRVPPSALLLAEVVKRRLRRAAGKPVWPSLVRYQIATGTRDLVYGAERLEQMTGWSDVRTRRILQDGGVE